jgi:hypothetical protein
MLFVVAQFQINVAGVDEQLSRSLLNKVVPLPNCPLPECFGRFVPQVWPQACELKANLSRTTIWQKIRKRVDLMKLKWTMITYLHSTNGLCCSSEAIYRSIGLSANRASRLQAFF